VSPRDKLFLVTMAVVVGGLLVAITWLGFIEWRRRRRSAWNKRFARARFADSRFRPTREELEQRLKTYAEYEKPTYLRTRAEDQRLLPSVMRRQA
jgi:hypothetical protein